MNKRIKILLISILILLFLIFNSADFTNGVFIEGSATSLFITGFGGLSLPFSTGSFLINPSLAAPLYQDEGALLFGGFSGFLYVSSYFNFITDFGNLSFFGSYIGNYTNINYIIIKTSFSKMINESFYAGFNLNLFTNNFANFGFGFDFGITSINNEQIPIGFSFSRFSYAFVIKNLGLPIKIALSGSEEISSPPIGVGAGGSFTFLNISNIIFSKVYSDLYLYFYPLGFGLKIGLIFNIFDYIDIVTAFNVGTQNTSIMESAWFFLGLSFKIPIKNNTLNASYSYTPASNGGQHSITTSFAFGKVDTTPPKAELIVESDSKRNAFSPNYDGQKDEINIKTKFSDNGIIAGWKIEIINQNNEVVKEYIGQDVRKISYLTLKKILSRLFEKRKAVDVPDFIIWDGSNKDGNIVTDGIYKVVATVWDERYNIIESEPKYITVDTKIDTFEIITETKIFSPNKDGNLDTLPVLVNFDEYEEYGKCQLNIFDINDSLINTYNFEKNSIKDKKLEFLWDGIASNGKAAIEGNYVVSVKYYDDAGNSLIKKSEKIKLVIDYEILKLSLQSENPYFSSNKISNKNRLDFNLDLSSIEGIKSLTYYVLDSNGNTIYSKTYDNNISKNFSWDGINNDNKVVEDGKYTIIAAAKYDSGNEPKSNEIIIFKDSIAPQVEIKEEYSAFSPNEDGVQDTITFEVNKEDKSKIVEVQIISSTGQKYDFSNDSVKDGKFIWDGKDQEGNELAQGSYYLEFKVVDQAGNTIKIQSKVVNLVRKAEEIAINSDIYYYSPNNDKRNDIINFSIQAENSSNIIGMDFIIENSDNNIAYTKHFTKFNSSIQFSEKLPEGKFNYYLKVFYNNGNAPSSLKRNFIVDLTPPEIKLSSTNQYFTTKDPFASNVKIDYDIKENTSSIYYRVNDSADKKIFEQQISEEDGKIEWNGKNQDKTYPEGVYNIYVTALDMAGNLSENNIPVYLVLNTPKVSLESKYNLISPNNDGLYDDTEVKIISDSTKIIDKLNKKEIIIKNNDGQIIKTYELSIESSSFLFTANDLADGLYNIGLKLSYASGIIDNADINITIDKAPPKIDLVIKPELFSPDSDGEKDTLFITYSISDFSEIDSYTIRIFRIFEEGKKSVKPFKVFQFSKAESKVVTNQLQWDGKGDEPGSLVDSASDYQLVITATDKAGNEVNINQNFTVDILVMKTDLGYKIIINSIEFDLNSAVLKKSNFKILDLLIKKLLKFPDYKILIVGFTDSTGDPAYNLKLSEQRAKAVYDYLVKNDIPKSRLEYKGMGMANPIDSNDNEEGRRRNRRVEFYLIKMNQ